MGKYFEITKIYMKTQLVWRADVLFNMIFTITKVLFAFLLWGMVFNHKELVGGFTFHGMLSYYIVNDILSDSALRNHGNPAGAKNHRRNERRDSGLWHRGGGIIFHNHCCCLETGTKAL